MLGLCFTADGKVYGVPHDIDLSAVFYNKVLFRKAGLDRSRIREAIQRMSPWHGVAGEIR